MARTLINCDCGELSHLFSLEVDDWDDDYLPDLYVSVMMNHYQPLYKRLWIALRYISGYESYKYHYVEFVINNPEKLRQIRDVVQQAIDKHEKVQRIL